MSSQPRVRRRRSFGGKDGVWWRNRRVAPSSKEAPKNRPDTIQWNDELCRPIFSAVRAEPVVSDHGGIEDSGEEEENSSLVVVATVEDPQQLKLDFSQKPSTKKKKKKRSFGGRSRPPTLSLGLMEDFELELPSQSPKKKQRCTEAPDPEEPASPLSLPSTSSLTSTSSSALSHTLPTNENTRRVSTSPEQDVTPIDGTVNGSPINDIFAFGEDAASDKGIGRPATTLPLPRPSAHSSLQSVKDYFAHLDATVSLQLEANTNDSGHVPPSSSRVVRTSRKLQVTSPQLQEDYRNYVLATRGSGVQPLSIQSYASSRREHFRKTELYDGFLDD